MTDPSMPQHAPAGCADYHIHTKLCRHAEGELEEYVAAAVRSGLDEIGFSDHNPMPEPFDDWRMDISEFGRYLEMVGETRAKFPGLPIRLGLECDFIPGKEDWIEKLAGLADWDYLIGSVHYIDEGWDVDNRKWLSRMDEGSVAEIWDIYFKRLEAAVRSRLFDFIGHPDLPKKFGHRPEGDLSRFYGPVIEAMADTGTPFEINTAGLRMPVGEAYPATGFLGMASQAGLGLLINSDAHLPEHVGFGFADAVASARAAGFGELVRFAGRKATAVPLPQ